MNRSSLANAQRESSKDLLPGREPSDRSRSGFSSKIHALCNGVGKTLQLQPSGFLMTRPSLLISPKDSGDLIHSLGRAY